MRLSIDSSQLAAVLSRIKPCIDHKGVPILQCVKIVANGNSIKLLAYNMQSLQTDTCAAKIDEDGEFCVDHDAIFRLVRSLPNGSSCSLSIFGSELKLKSGRTSASFLMEEGRKFPGVSHPERRFSFDIDAQNLLAGISGVVHADDAGELRPTVKGISLKQVDSSIEVCSASSGGMAVRSVAFSGEIDPVHINTANIKPLIQFLTGISGPVSVYGDENKFAIQCGKRQISVSLSEYDYLDYSKVIPSLIDAETVNVDRLALIKLLSRSLDFSDSLSNGIVLSVSKDEIAAHPLKTKGGQIDDAIICDTSLSRTFGLNGKDAVSALKSMSGVDVTISVTHKDAAPIHVTDGNGFDLLMPIKIGPMDLMRRSA